MAARVLRAAGESVQSALPSGTTLVERLRALLADGQLAAMRKAGRRDHRQLDRDGEPPPNHVMATHRTSSSIASSACARRSSVSGGRARVLDADALLETEEDAAQLLATFRRRVGLTAGCAEALRLGSSERVTPVRCRRLGACFTSIASARLRLRKWQ
jgi:hypothetical protein